MVVWIVVGWWSGELLVGWLAGGWVGGERINGLMRRARPGGGGGLVCQAYTRLRAINSATARLQQMLALALRHMNVNVQGWLACLHRARPR